MSSNYSGVPTAAQAPAPAPTAGKVPIIVIPDDADAFNAAAFAQQFKMSADYLAWLMQGYLPTKMPVFDHFVGGAIDTGDWSTISGTTINDDSANGSFGAVRLDSSGGGQSLVSGNLALGTADFLLRARLRVANVSGSTQMSFGVNTSTNLNLNFKIDGGVSTNWRLFIDNSNTAPTATIAVSSSYKILEIERTGTTVVFRIDGAVLHTLSGTYATNLTGANVQFVAAAGSTQTYLDYVQLLVA
jgi:hypothetical protein